MNKTANCSQLRWHLAWPDSWISVTSHQRTQLHLSVYWRINFAYGETSGLVDSHKTVYQIPCCSVHSRFIWRCWVNASHFTALNGWMTSEKWTGRNVEAEGSGLICSTISADIRTRNPCSKSRTHNTLSCSKLEGSSPALLHPAAEPYYLQH